MFTYGKGQESGTEIWEVSLGELDSLGQKSPWKRDCASAGELTSLSRASSPVPLMALALILNILFIVGHSGLRAHFCVSIL